jgi:hypothetical protein
MLRCTSDSFRDMVERLFLSGVYSVRVQFGGKWSIGAGQEMLNFIIRKINSRLDGLLDRYKREIISWLFGLPERFVAALWKYLKDFLWSFVILVLLAVLARLAIEYGHNIYPWLVRIIGPYFSQIAIGSVIALIGWTAYRFKLRSQRWYGIVEAIFGGVSGYAIAFTLAPGKALLPQWASLVGCAYVIARGLNNMRDSRTAVNIRTSSASRMI